MNIQPFRVEHLRRMDVQESQQYLTPYIQWDEMASLANEFARTVTTDSGLVLLCGGLVPMTEYRAVLWSYFSSVAGPYMVGLVRAVRQYLQAAPFRRIETFVDCEFEEGHRLIRLLGFTIETSRKRAHRPDGGDSAEYVLLR